MPEVALVSAAIDNQRDTRLAELIEYELGLQSVPAAHHRGRFPEPHPGLVYLLLDPHAYLAAPGARLPGDRILARTVFVSTDPAGLDDDAAPPVPWERAGAVFALDQRRRDELERRGIRTRLLRPGYSRYLDCFDREAERSVDVALVGGGGGRGGAYLTGIRPVLARHDLTLEVLDALPGSGGASSPSLQRQATLARTKVMISLHDDDDGGRLDWLSAVAAIEAGAVVVTEHCSGMTPLVAGEHLLVAGPESAPYVATALLRDEARLAGLRERAYDRVSRWLPFALPISVLRAALVELVGQPL